MGDATLLQLSIEISVGKAALRPVFASYDVAFLRHEIGVPLAAPAVFGENPMLVCADLRRVGMILAFIVSLLPAAVGDEEHGNSLFPS